jgi:thioredoxin-dependent peroxiredoxin
MGEVAHLGLEERAGEAFELDARLTVVGRQLRAGERAPEFALDWLDPKAGAVRLVRLAHTVGQVRLLSVVNSVDTPVCQAETHRWEALRADLPRGVLVCTVSMDLPFALARWQAAAGVTHQLLSAHRDERFGRDYGVLLKEWRLLQRAVFVIGRDDRVVYAEYVADQLREPDYGATAAAAERAAG